MRLGDKETETLATGVYLITLKIGIESPIYGSIAKPARDKFETYATYAG